MTWLKQRLSPTRIATHPAPHPWRQSSHMPALQQGIMGVTLSSKQDVGASLIFPILGILARVGAACRQDLVSSPDALAGADAISAYEHHNRQLATRTRPASEIGRPAREEVVVALDLRRGDALRQTIVELDDQLRTPLAKQRRVGPDALE